MYPGAQRQQQRGYVPQGNNYPVPGRPSNVPPPQPGYYGAPQGPRPQPGPPPPGYPGPPTNQHAAPGMRQPPAPNRMQPGRAQVTIQKDHKFITKPKVKVDVRQCEFLANFYSIIIAVENLESLWSGGFVPNAEYETVVTQLIAQYKQQKGRIDQHYRMQNKTHNEFFRVFAPQCTTAKYRLEQGMPATIEFKANDGQDKKKNIANIAKTTQCFVTLVDLFEMNQNEVSTILPEIQTLVNLLNKFPDLPDSNNAQIKPRKWFAKINNMKASEALDDEDIQQAQLDIQTAYEAFVLFLEG